MQLTDTSEDDKLKREDEINRLLKKYISLWNSMENVEQIFIVDNGAKKIVSVYYELLHKVIKVYLPTNSNANKFKVASGTELSCMATMPLKFTNDTITRTETRYLNARFAVFAATNMLLSVNYDSHTDFKPTKHREQLNKVNLNHITWLRYYDISNINLAPTFLNANYWEAFLLAATTE